MLKLAQVAIFGITLILAACDPSASGSKDPVDISQSGALVDWVRKHYPAYVNVEFINGNLTLESKSSSDHMVVFHAGDSIYKITKALKAAGKNNSLVKSVKISRKTELVDQYRNNIGLQNVITIVFDYGEVLRYNIDNSTAFDMLEAAKIDFIHPVYRDAPQKYCERSREYSRRFCLKHG
jgi:hypothetical protein